MIRTLARYIKQYQAASIITPLFMILEVIMEMIVPLMMGSIVDDGVYAGNMQHILLMGSLMIVVAIVGLAAGMLGGKYGAKASTGFARNLRTAMFRNIQRFSFSNIDKFSTAGLITRLTTDVTNVQNAYQMLLRMCMRAPVTMIIAMCLSFRVSAQLASIYLIAVIALGGVLAIIMTRATKYFRIAFPKYDDLNGSVQENVSAIRVVKAYVREPYETEKFKKASTNIYHLFTKAERILAFNSPFMSLAVYTCMLLISWLGAKMIVGGTLSTGNLMALLTYCMSILMSLMMVSMIFVMMAMSIESMRRIAEVLNEKSDISNPENPLMNVPDGSIVFDHVNFGYRKDKTERVLKDINLSIRAGETIGIIGSTGSAKTSFVSLISRLYDVSSGSVQVGGHDVREYDLETLRNQVSVVLQKNELFSGTIRDNLKWGDENATDAEMLAACRAACADEFIQKMPDGYDTHIEQGGTNVSGGQKQRLCIARALLKKPKILILDDSTSAVDTGTDAKIRRSFREVIPGTTKLIIAQRISSVQDADHILVLEDGRVDGFGTHAELLESNAIYREVYESQTGGSGDFDEKEGDA